MLGPTSTLGPTVLSVLVCWTVPALLWRVVSTRPVGFSFGLVADVQAGDKPNGSNDGRVQYYREAFDKLGMAAAFWRAQCGGALWYLTRLIGGHGINMRCVLSLGDAVDGNTSEEITAAELRTVLAHFDSVPCPKHHVVGNHCIKKIPRDKGLAMLGHVGARAYYAAELAPGWRLLVLDTTDLSIHGGWAPGSPQDAEARAYLSAHEGAERIQRYNGGVGVAQM
eukprot:6982194-Prymnesium_polylepis.1